MASHKPLTPTFTGFPLEIQSHPDKGRGFYATCPIAAGTEVFVADPMAAVVCEDWLSNVCMWCFKFDDSKRWKVRAVETTAKNGDAMCKEVFCSQDCRDRQKRDGKRKVWGLVTVALKAISGELVRRKRSLQVLTKKQKKARKPNFNHHHHENSLGSVVIDDDVGDNPLVVASSQQQQQQQQQPNSQQDRDQEFFDLADNELLDQFIGDTWTRLLNTGFYEQNYIPAPDHLETLKLIVIILAKKEVEDQQQKQKQQQQSSSSSELNLEAYSSQIKLGLPSEPHQSSYIDLLHMQSNEKNVFLRDYRKKHQLDEDDNSTCILLPKNPDSTPVLVADLPNSIKDTIALFSFFQVALSKSSSFNPDHSTFRAIYYREVANSFGMWDRPSSSTATTDLNTEQEILGYAIYPTAVYFNHSCHPNITRVREDRRMRFFANRHVEKGEECQISYGSVAETMVERRNRLWNHYFFVCGCLKCIEEEGKGGGV